MKLQVLLKGITQLDSDFEVISISNHNKKIEKNCLFLAEAGIKSHGLDHLSQKNIDDCGLILYQPPYDLSRFKHTEKFIAIDNLNDKVGIIAKQFYQTKQCDIIAVTGTNGKTSTTHFIAQLTDAGVIGTTGYGNINHLAPSSHTTPNALDLSYIVSEIAKDHDTIAMEVSSHALSLKRVNHINFKIAVYTNLSQDHLDFHNNMEDYFLAKSALFKFKTIQYAIINADDPYSDRLIDIALKNNKTILTYGKKILKGVNTYIQIQSIKPMSNGLHCVLKIKTCNQVVEKKIALPILGEFNVYNALAAVLASYCLNKEKLEHYINKLTKISGVCGRVQPIHLSDNKTVIIDYAHTPDALIQVLKSIKAHCQGNLYTLFGCGGDRDKSKRPQMAMAVNNYSDFGIITDDNPRTEESSAIINDILSADIDNNRFNTISDRKKAIFFALSQLKDNDILVIAGKGHETYQIIGTKTIYFSDHDVVKEWINENTP